MGSWPESGRVALASPRTLRFADTPVGLLAGGIRPTSPPLLTTPLLLWDLATLVPTPELDREVHRTALARELGRPAPRILYRPDRRTDPVVAVDLLDRSGRDGERASSLPRLLAALALVLRQRGLRPADVDGPPGVGLETVELVSRHCPGLKQGVVAASVRPNALLKLRATGLDRHLSDARAYGSDDCRWDVLIGLALARSGTAAGVVVATGGAELGAAARRAGATVVAVAPTTPDAGRWADLVVPGPFDVVTALRPMVAPGKRRPVRC
ncbi:hypothetical protein [Micromonospora sp. WMMA1947]|uniref:hypothetical protein n=1 Tax=Micromonospora sp. WMMA1947 TaxID=3015163 RepID=UPI00248ADB3F|nr:hypothetical protein [Micromonospora sp. WMMA1947]WBC07483.1 hypothetical protein O7604_19925 [Micromonospora sp. WMMA1947]